MILFFEGRGLKGFRALEVQVVSFRLWLTVQGLEGFGCHWYGSDYGLGMFRAWGVLVVIGMGCRVA